MIINAGFNFNGIDQTIPQFSGVFSKQPRVDLRKDCRFWHADYVDFFQEQVFRSGSYVYRTEN